MRQLVYIGKLGYDWSPVQLDDMACLLQQSWLWFNGGSWHEDIGRSVKQYAHAW